MRVVRLHGPRDLRIGTEPEPIPPAGERLVRITAVGICGSDLHWMQDGAIGETRLERPLVLGHEFAGVVDSEVGGAMVAVDPAVTCGTCVRCQEGDPNLCESTRFAGHGLNDGALQEYLSWPDHCLVSLPSGFTPADGAMLEPLGVAIHSVDLGKVRPGMSVGVFGSGPIGLLTLQVARVAGATRIVATDLLEHRLEAATKLGAHEVFRARGGMEADAIVESTGGVDVAFDAAGTNEALAAAVESVRPGGRVVVIGIPSEDETLITASTVRRKGLTIKWVRRMKHTYPRAIELVRSGAVDVRSMISHTFPLEQFDAAFRVALSREGLKVMIQS